MRRCLLPPVLAAFLLPGCQREQRFPNRPITLICPWAAGGGTDRVSRQIAVGLEQELGVPVNVVNATGGGGVTGHSRGALSRPDGYTLTTITPELTMLHWRGMTDVTFHDFQPLMSVNGDYAALFVRADSKYDTIEKLKEAIQTASPKIKASGSAFGSIWHVALAGWLDSVGLPPDAVNWIPHNGSNPSLNAMAADGVDVVCCSVPEAQARLEAGSVRCIAVMAESPVTIVLDEEKDIKVTIPTLRASGSNYVLSGWRGIALPNGVPEERARVLLSALRKVVNGPEYREFLKKQGFGHRAGEPKEFVATLEESDEKFGAVFTSEAFAALEKQRYGPHLFPLVLASLFALTLTGVYCTGQWKRADDVLTVPRDAALRIAVVLATLVFYVLAAEWLGFVITAAMVMVVLLKTFAVRWSVTLALTVCLVPAVYQLFAVGLRSPLPRGLLAW